MSAGQSCGTCGADVAGSLADHYAAVHPRQGRSYSTDPGWYTEPQSLVGVPTDVLQVVWHNAREAYMVAGGHQHAARMQRVMRLTDEALTARLGDAWTEVQR